MYVQFNWYMHCYKNYSPLQLVGTKHHGFVTLVGPKSKHFGFQYKLMGEGYDVLKVHNRVITSAKSLNLLSTSWNCSKEFELASLEAWLVVQTIWYLGKSNSLILPITKMTFRPKFFVFETQNSLQNIMDFRLWLDLGPNILDSSINLWVKDMMS